MPSFSFSPRANIWQFFYDQDTHCELLSKAMKILQTFFFISFRKECKLKCSIKKKSSSFKFRFDLLVYKKIEIVCNYVTFVAKQI